MSGSGGQCVSLKKHRIKKWALQLLQCGPPALLALFVISSIIHSPLSYYIYDHISIVPLAFSPTPSAHVHTHRTKQKLPRPGTHFAPSFLLKLEASLQRTNLLRTRKMTDTTTAAAAAATTTTTNRACHETSSTINRDKAETTAPERDTHNQGPFLLPRSRPLPLCRLCP